MSSDRPPQGSVEIWNRQHPRWAELLEVVNALEQADWFEASFDWDLSDHTLVALANGQVAGFLSYIVQYIGVDEDLPRVTYQGQPLTEAKVRAFGVVELYRRRGLGRVLQIAAVDLARSQGCYQFRSFSSGDHPENHQLKLSMGFAVYPIQRGQDNHAAYFIMPLQPSFE